jgi:thiol-disulfide isomerase/thioredoxin
MSGAPANSSGASPSTPPEPPGGDPASAGAPPGGTAAPLGRAAKLALAAVAACALAALLWPRGESAAPGGFLLDAAGRPAPLGSQLAPVTLVHFWATWCPPCIEETPAIQRLAADLSGHPDFAVLMVAVADSNTRVQGFLGSRHADMVLYDPRWDVAHRYGTRQLPETYLVVGGQVVRKFVGMTNWDDAGLRRDILRRLSGGTGAAPGERRRGG